MYQALYRKWRPMSFDDVVSQPHITTTLKNQIKSGKTAHAYLFTGSRGTGKTTCARIFAKAINCLDPHDGEPCLECEICKDADNGTLSDIIEIDAASNSKVDDIRELREGVVYTPERCKYKVYIIDEVHMLSAGAFNALLKTMEEPPPHVKFILATTEIHKVPATIVSRCQHFDFHRIRNEDIVSRLMYIASQEGFTLHEDAAGMIARLSDGGMRDALSLLDQCVAYENDITLDVVSSASGIAGRDYLFDILEKIAEKDAAGALRVVDKLYDMSKDLKVLAGELLAQMRNVMIIKTIDNNKDLITCLPDEYERLKALAERMKLDEILGDINTLQECSERMGKALNKRIEFEMCLIKLCSVQIQQKTIDNTEIYDKIKQVDNVSVPEKTERPAETEETASPKPAVNMSQLKASDFKPLAEWSEILAEFTKVSPSVSGTLAGSRAFVYSNIMLIDTKNQFFLKLFKVKENFALLTETIRRVMGKSYVIKARCSAAAESEQKAGKLIEKAVSSGIETVVE